MVEIYQDAPQTLIIAINSFPITYVSRLWWHTLNEDETTMMT